MSRFWELFSLRKIRGVVDYQFGRDVGRRLFPDEVEITHSKRTGRVRHIYLDGKLLATLRPTDGLFSLTIEGARRLSEIVPPPRLRVVVQKDVSAFIRRGGNVFAKHVVEADPEFVPREEAIVTDTDGNVLAVGKTVLSGGEMLAFKRGVAVKVRRGVGG